MTTFFKSRVSQWSNESFHSIDSRGKVKLIFEQVIIKYNKLRRMDDFLQGLMGTKAFERCDRQRGSII
jgi:hypothetical protein